MNIVAPAMSDETIAGLMVGVSIAPLREWLAGSRKLSDLWLASWLASVMVWYMVKDLVWCLGPDILLLPGFRWNQLYYALLKEKLDENIYDAFVKDVVEGYGFFEGFPYYPWQPAFQILLLPIIRAESNVGGECSEVVKVLHSKNNDTVKALEEVEGKIKEYLEERFREAWKHVVEAVRDNAPGRLGELIDKLIDMGLLLDEPPFEPIIAVRKLYVEDVKKGKKNYSIAKMKYAKAFNELVAEMEEKESQAKPGWARNKALQEITEQNIDDKLKKAIGCGFQTERIDRELRKHRWRSCTVCKHAPAILWVPGRELPGGRVSDDYKEWAMRTLCTPRDDGVRYRDLEECWTTWRPVFKPGERLCPYCLIKRLAGLNTVFNEIALRLLGLTPDKEVSFPSTSDVAGLAVKIALLQLAAMIASGEVEVDKEILREVSEKLRIRLLRSRLHEELYRRLEGNNGNGIIEALRNLVNKRWWTPRLLWINVRRLGKILEEARNNISMEELEFIASVLLFVDSEIEEALYERPEASRALSKLARALRDAEKSMDTVEKAETIRAIREALTSTRRYYGIIWFDGDKYGMLKRGILGTDIGKNVDEIKVRNYLYKLFNTVYSDEIIVRGGTVNAKKLEASKRVIEEYLEGHIRAYGLVEMCEKGSLYCGSIIVSPSYHYAIANAISYTSLRTAIVTERLGGIPVYMAGDEGLIIAPTWLPWNLLPEKTRNGYRREVLRALGLDPDEPGNQKLLRYVSSNPSLTISLLARRIYWASSSAKPGFHPVKKRGVGRVYWRIPAIISNGLSMGVRFAHYKDSMYDELWLTRYLLEEAKSRFNDVWIGDSVTISYGRPGYMLLRGRELGGGVYAKIPYALSGRGNILEQVRSAGLFYAAVNLFAGLVEGNILSTSIFRDKELLFGGGEGARHVWDNAFRHGLYNALNLTHYLLKRNISAKSKRIMEEYFNLAEKVFNTVLGKLWETLGYRIDTRTAEILFNELFKASHMALKSMRTIK